MDLKKSTAPTLSKTWHRNARNLRREIVWMSRPRPSKIMLSRLKVYNLKRKQKDHLLHLK